MRSLAICLLVLASPAFADRPRVNAFTLKDVTGKEVSLADHKDAKAVVVVFLGTQCPINNAYLPRLAELHRTYAEKGVRFLAIDSNRHDDAARVAAHAKENQVPFPVLKDDG